MFTATRREDGGFFLGDDEFPCWLVRGGGGGMMFEVEGNQRR